MQVFSSFIIIFNYNASQQHYESGFFSNLFMCSFISVILFYFSIPRSSFIYTAPGLISIPSQ